jgi:hypothetical protein
VPSKGDQALAELLQGYLYENCGIWLEIAEEGTAGSRVLITNAKAAEKDGFEAVVENGECVLMYELKCRVGFSHSVREYDKQDGTKVTINNIRCYKFEIAGQQGQQPQRPAGYAAGTTAAPTIPPQAQPMAAPTMEQQAPFPPFPPQPAGGQVDDLPF